MEQIRTAHLKVELSPFWAEKGKEMKIS